MTHVMVDLETMGTSPNSAIVAIGAVAFDHEGIFNRFYKTINLENAVRSGLTIDPDTVMWWLKQSDDAKKAITSENQIPLWSALLKFNTWAQKVNLTYLWGNGAAFDNVILANAYKATNIPQPWKYYNDRCYRTIKSLYPEIKIIRNGTHHNALDDAECQALHLIDICKRHHCLWKALQHANEVLKGGIQNDK